MGVTAGIVEFGHFHNAEQEGPHLVRSRKADFQRRINGQLTLRYEAGGLTSFAGLELAGRLIRRLDLRALLKGVEKTLPRSDFGAARLSLLVLAMLISGARRVFNPHRRRVPSYYPITAYEANTGQVLRVGNRAGNVHDGKASVSFLEALFEQLDATLERRPVLEMRMDGAFFRADVIDVLDAEGVEYAIKVPFWRWLGLKERIAECRYWSSA